MTGFGIALLSSFFTAIIVVRIAHLQRRWGFDDATGQSRKIHDNPVPRLGGAAILIAAWFSGSVLNHQEPQVGSFLLAMLMTSLPAFLVGLGEDLSGRLSPRTRLLGMVFASMLLMGMLNIFIVRVDVGFIDNWLMQASGSMQDPLSSTALPSSSALDWYHYPLSSLLIFALTLFALLSITNGINLIDGLNGLAGLSSMLMYLGMGAVAFDVGDRQVAACAFALAGAVAGFFVWNWPRGYLFLGDGGAYFIGFTLGSLCIALVQRNPDVSAWFAVLLLVYPLTEVGFSVWRRRVVKGQSIGIPDAAHLHHLIYRRIVREAIGRTPSESRSLRNAFAAPYLWTMTAMSVFPAVALYRFPFILAICTLSFVFGYVWLYLRIVRLRAPHFLIRRSIPIIR